MNQLRKASVLLCIAMLLFQHSLFTDKALASSEVGVLINGQALNFDQPPIIESGRVLVPMRAIFETLGADVQWEGKTQTITAKKETLSIKLQIDKKDALINGKTSKLDVPAKIVNNRTLVPLRFISESFGATVEWTAKERLVVIQIDGIEVPKQKSEPKPSGSTAQQVASKMVADYGFVSSGENNAYYNAYGTSNSGRYQILLRADHNGYKFLIDVRDWKDGTPEYDKIPPRVSAMLKMILPTGHSQVYNIVDQGYNGDLSGVGKSMQIDGYTVTVTGNDYPTIKVK